MWMVGPPGQTRRRSPCNSSFHRTFFFKCSISGANFGYNPSSRVAACGLWAKCGYELLFCTAICFVELSQRGSSSGRAASPPLTLTLGEPKAFGNILPEANTPCRPDGFQALIGYDYTAGRWRGGRWLLFQLVSRESDPSACLWYSGCTYGYSAQHPGLLLLQRRLARRQPQ